MKPRTTDEVLDLLDAALPSAALGAALELGLFWLLEKRPVDAAGVAGALGIPVGRCRCWLRTLCEAGLIVEGEGGFAPSPAARSAIIGAYSQPTWAMLAEEARERLPGLRDLPRHIREGGSVWTVLGLPRPLNYVDRMSRDPERARRFTRMLYEIHEPLAAGLADFLDMSGVGRLMDLGGGSGVMSIALARRHPGLTAVVVDLENVCAAGREIAAESGLEGRVRFHPADFLRDDLPSGFDMVLECDVNVYSEDLFRKVHAALRPGGRYVIVDQFAPAAGLEHPSRVTWALERALDDPGFQGFLTAAEIGGWLASADFHTLPAAALPPVRAGTERSTAGMLVLEAHRRSDG